MLYISILYKQITSTENDRLYASQLGQAITLPFPNPLYKRLIWDVRIQSSMQERVYL